MRNTASMIVLVLHCIAIVYCISIALVLYWICVVMY